MYGVGTASHETFCPIEVRSRHDRVTSGAGNEKAFKEHGNDADCDPDATVSDPGLGLLDVRAREPVHPYGISASLTSRILARGRGRGMARQQELLSLVAPPNPG